MQDVERQHGFVAIVHKPRVKAQVLHSKAHQSQHPQPGTQIVVCFTHQERSDWAESAAGHTELEDRPHEAQRTQQYESGTDQ